MKTIREAGIEIKFDGDIDIEKGTYDVALYADVILYVTRVSSGYRVSVQSEFADEQIGIAGDATRKCFFSKFSDVEKLIEKFNIKRVYYSQYNPI